MPDTEPTVPARNPSGPASYGSDEHDLKFADAIRSMIDQETTVVSNRMNWLILLQALLFTAVGQMQSNVPVIIIIAAVGCAISVSMRKEFTFSERAIAEILQRWDRFKADRSRRGTELPDLPPAFAGANVEASRTDRWFASRRLLPWVFGLAWVAIAVYYLLF